MIFRVVDGEGYEYRRIDPATNLPTSDPNVPLAWRHLPGDYAPEVGPFNLDPRTFLEALSSAGNFEEVGREDVDGVPARRLRAATPEEALDLGNLRHGVEGTATSLEVWVDEDDLVRRLDYRIDDPWDLEGAWSVSVRFFDLGEPVVIEAPADAPEWVPPPDDGTDADADTE